MKTPKMGADGASLSLEAFQRMLDVHGADAVRWPEGQRAAALALVAASADAAQRLDEARALDVFLDAAPPVQPSADLMDRVLADWGRQVGDAAPAAATFGGAACRRAEPRRGWRGLLDVLWPDRPAWQPAAVFGASLIAGLSLGLIQPSVVAGFGSVDSIETADVSDLIYLDSAFPEVLQ